MARPKSLFYPTSKATLVRAFPERQVIREKLCAHETGYKRSPLARSTTAVAELNNERHERGEDLTTRFQPTRNDVPYASAAWQRLEASGEGDCPNCKKKIETLKSAAQEQGGAAVEEIKTVAQSATRQAQEAGRDFIDEQKENLARKVDQYAEAMRAACERLRSEEGNVLVAPAQKAVDQLERMSGYLREKQPADLLDDLESYARRRPEVVFGGLFVVGLAAARFFKASRRRPRRA